MISRELVKQTLEFKNVSNRVPRQLWYLPLAIQNNKEMYNRIKTDFPDDIGYVPAELRKPTIARGNPYIVGKYVDEWGCVYTNIHEGIIGEVKDPLIPADDYEWDNVGNIHIPEEVLSFDIDKVNEECSKSGQFILSGYCPRPFEQLQFIRGTENLYMDLLDPPKKMLEFLKVMHDFYCRLMIKWVKTDVDALTFMDDWGSQRSLLINPELWCEYFKPMYKDYIDIAKSHGKKSFMHSDGFTLDIIPHLIEIGLDAFNCQIFCIGLDRLEQFKGKLTFWGEIDRQYLLSQGSLEEIEAAVKSIYTQLWQNGGCIAQLEFGASAKSENVYKAFETWDKIRNEDLMHTK